MKPHTFIADSCPMCGKPDSARQCDSRWGHHEMCCSDECGEAYGDSAQRARREIEKQEAIIAHARKTRMRWRRALRDVIAKGGGK